MLSLVFGVYFTLTAHSICTKHTHKAPGGQWLVYQTVQHILDSLTVQICSTPHPLPVLLSLLSLVSMTSLLSDFCLQSLPYCPGLTLLLPGKEGPWISQLTLSALELLPHFSLLQPWATPASAHLTAIPQLEEQGQIHASKRGCPTSTDQAALTTESPLPDSRCHSPQLILQPSPSLPSFSSHLTLIVLPALQRNKGQMTRDP